MMGSGVMTDVQSDDASGYAMTYYPGTPSVAEAQRVTVGIGEEAVADIQLIPTRVSRVGGTVTTSTGKPATAGMVMLQPRGGDELAGIMMGGGNGGQIKSDGTFTISGVAVGSYQLVVNTFAAENNPSADSMESAAMAITVGGQDLTDLRLATSKGLTLSGHVTFEGGTPDATATKQLQVMCSPVDFQMRMNGRPGHVAEDGTFEVKGIYAPCTVGAFGLPPGWTLKSVQLNGVDITERPFEPAGKPVAGFEVTITNRLTTLTGSVQGAQDQASKEYTVIVFPEDSEKWQGPSLNRYTRRARPDQTGTFKVTGLPPARYFVVAFDHVDDDQDLDAEFLARIRSQATRTELSEGGTQTVSLKLGTLGGD
jgi:hypothetical protein